MNILLPIVQKIHKAVKDKYYDDISELTPKSLKKDTELPIWEAKDENGEVLFYRIIAGNNKYLKPSYSTAIAVHGHTNKKIHVTQSGLEYTFFNEDNLMSFLQYLGFRCEVAEEGLFEFCSNPHYGVTLEEIRHQKLIPTGRKSEKFDSLLFNDYAVSVSDDFKSYPKKLKQIAQLRNELGRLMFTSANLENTQWWLYLHGYQRHKIEVDKINTWPLVKLVLTFGEINQEGDLFVKLDNTGIEHYDYIGTVDFQSSRTEILVINLNTIPYYGRQLNLKIHIGTGEGNIFLGQYLNYESDNHIISGTIVLERIKNEIEPEPKVYYIDNLNECESEYLNDVEDISCYILEYLHDRVKNFRRTPLRSGHDLHGLKKWLDTRKKEDAEK